jgi:hypothetical protein
MLKWKYVLGVKCNNISLFKQWMARVSIPITHNNYFLYRKIRVAIGRNASGNYSIRYGGVQIRKISCS